MLSLLISILLTWLLLRWLFSRTRIAIDPPPSPPQIVIHIHSAQILVSTGG